MSPVAHLTAHPARVFLLLLLPLLLPLLLEVGSLGGFVLSLRLVGIFLHYVGSRFSLSSTSVFVFCPRLLFNIQRTNDILNKEFMPLIF
jgi:hypothetical protein